MRRAAAATSGTSSTTVVSATPSAGPALALMPVARPMKATRRGSGWSSSGTSPRRRSVGAAALPPRT